MLGRIEEGTGFFCLDSAYLAKKICDAISDKGMVPRIRPKSNTVCKNGGSQAWGDMARTYRDELSRFMDEYHQRSIIEAVFGAIKKIEIMRSQGHKDPLIFVSVLLFEVVISTDISVSYAKVYKLM